MKFQYATVALAGLAIAAPSDLETRQSTPAVGSPESFAQASKIMGQIAKGMQGLGDVPFGQDAAKIMQGLADGVGKAGQSVKGSSYALDRRQTATTAAPGSPESWAQASKVMGQIAKGMQGLGDVPFGQDAAKIMQGLADGVGKAGQSVAAGSKLQSRQATGGAGAAASILEGLAQGLKGASGVPRSGTASSSLSSLADRIKGLKSGSSTGLSAPPTASNL